MPIKLLPARLANQIAAGEVVERPASVVKELIENSLDARAIRIELYIEKGGHKRICVRDNGLGIPQTELELALSRHATSKIESLDDLESILSLGFRGEALASISSVSRLTLTSKPQQQEQAWEAYCEGRDMEVRLSPAAHPNGTSIDVADLFYNTPARRKFLRTEKTEFQHIEDVVKRIALSRPEITFILNHNNKLVKRYSSLNSQDAKKCLTHRVNAVCGKKFCENAIFLEVDYQDIHLSAWLGNQETMRSSTDMQFSFVNGRGMRDKLITHAIRQAYESVFAIAEQPAFVFYLSIKPEDVDVNVHPAKHEVRFHQGRLVHDFICKSVSDALVSELQPTGGLAKNEADYNHDYIQPLYYNDNESSASGASQYRTSQAPTSQVKDYPSRNAPSANKLPQLAENYAQLMQSESSSADNNVRFLNIKNDARIYTLDDKIIFLHISMVIKKWLEEKLTLSNKAQPLLMPIVLAGEHFSEEAVEFLRSIHFDIQLVQEKFRLLKVPSEMRHFPWLRLFDAMLNKSPTNAQELLGALAGNEDVWGETVYREIWHWFDIQPNSQQQNLLQQLGIAKTFDELKDWWQPTNE